MLANLVFRGQLKLKTTQTIDLSPLRVSFKISNGNHQPFLIRVSLPLGTVIYR